MRSKAFKLAFYDADSDTDILARILADTSDTRDFLTLCVWQDERHADILARMSVSASWNASFSEHRTRCADAHDCYIRIDVT